MRRAVFGIVLILAGCASPVMLRDPVSGEVRQCFQRGALPIINQRQCVAGLENMGWQQTTGAEVLQATQQQATQLDAEIKAAMEECRNARLSGVLKSHVASIQCSNPRVRDAYQRAGRPFMDLVDLLLANRLSDAEKIDQGKMSEADAILHGAQVASELTQESRRRLLETQTANARIGAVNAQADAANEQVGVARQQLWLQTQKMNNDNFNAQQQRQVDILRAGMPQQPVRLQTSCQRLGDFTYCN